MQTDILQKNLTDHIITAEKEYLIQSYARPDFVLVHGEGVMLYDSNGQAYLDWVAGIAVNALGYGDEGFAKVINRQLTTGLVHLSNLYHSAPQVELAKMLCEHSFADRVFFTNSGTEANEGALKFARKFAYENGQVDKTEIVCFSGAFHGRTFGSLSITPKDKYQKPFQPLLSGIRVAAYNDIDSARALIGPQTAAVIVEPIQGEGGVYVATSAFLRTLRDLCDQHQALLIFDEVQCGVGRTGRLWAHEESGVTPDIMTLAKPLAGGLPIGAILTTERVSSAIKVGDHGSTFAGSPLVTAVAHYVFNRIRQTEFLAHVNDVGAYLQERLSELNSPLIKEVRGRGLMVGVEFGVDVAPIIKAGYSAGLLMVNAGTNILRFVPPLIVQKSHVDTLINRLGLILEQLHG